MNDLPNPDLDIETLAANSIARILASRYEPISVDVWGDLEESRDLLSRSKRLPDSCMGVVHQLDLDIN